MVQMPGCMDSEKLIQEVVVPRAPLCGTLERAVSRHSGDLEGLGGGHEAASPRDRPEGQEDSFTLQLPAFYFELYSVWNTGLPTTLVLKYPFVIQHLS